MMIKQSTAVKILPFFMFASSDHVSGLAGLTPIVTLSKNGAAFAAPAGSIVDDGGGHYHVVANAVDSNTLGPLRLNATAPAADQCAMLYEVVAFDPDTVAVGALQPVTAGRKLDSDTNGFVTLKDASLTTAKLGVFALAKGTNITGFNDIAAGTAMALLADQAVNTTKWGGSAVTGMPHPTGSAVTLVADQAVNVTKWGGTTVTGMPMPTGTLVSLTADQAVNVTKWGGVTVTGMPLAASAYTVPDNTSIGLIKVKTDQMVFVSGFQKVVLNADQAVNVTKWGGTTVTGMPQPTDVAVTLPAAPEGYGANLSGEITIPEISDIVIELAKIPKVGQTHRWVNVEHTTLTDTVRIEAVA